MNVVCTSDAPYLGDLNAAHAAAITDARYNVAYFKTLPYVQGSYTPDLSNTIKADGASYNNSVITRGSVAYQRTINNIGAADNCPLNIASFLRSDGGIGKIELLLAQGNNQWMWYGTVEFVPGPSGGTGSVLVDGNLLVDNLGWGKPNFDSHDYIGQLRVIGFTGTPTHQAIYAVIKQSAR